jgi:RNA polymerase sigma-70 factor (ECF subfamily)
MTDAELISGCQENSKRHQKALYERYAPYMMGVCMRYASCEEEAEDLLQEGFITIFKKLDSFEGRGELGAWMRKIFVNTALMHYRKAKHQQQLVELESQAYKVESGSDPLQTLSAGELMQMMQQLPGGARMVFNLYAVEGYEHHEIAEQMGISVGTSKSQYSRARQLLRAQIDKEERRVRGSAL